jgi:hypothetical protein
MVVLVVVVAVVLMLRLTMEHISAVWVVHNLVVFGMWMADMLSLIGLRMSCADLPPPSHPSVHWLLDYVNESHLCPPSHVAHGQSVNCIRG